MDILDKLPINIIREMLTQGHEVTLESLNSENKVYLNLNTGMKSHLHLYYEDNKYIAKLRYDQEFVIEDPSDLYKAIRSAEHDRGFMQDSITYFYKNGFESREL
jgi:hypothetical protein